MIWKHASKQNPCPICGKDDWCTFGERAMLCQRVESSHAHANGGWYHFYTEGFTDFIPKIDVGPPAKYPHIPPARLASMMAAWRSETKAWQLQSCASMLNVSVSSLSILGAAWCPERYAWAFPMHDGATNVIGIRLRNDSGFKWAYPGSRNGIFLPIYGQTFPGSRRAYLPEGPTSTAALVSLGLFAVGRPNCMLGAEMIRDYLHSSNTYEAVVVADNDERKLVGNKVIRPGVEYAQKFRSELGMKSCIYYSPSPYKDVRQLLARGYTRAAIEAEVNQKHWGRK